MRFASFPKVPQGAVGHIAQLVEHGIENAGVRGSSPRMPIDWFSKEPHKPAGVGFNADPLSICDSLSTTRSLRRPEELVYSQSVLKLHARNLHHESCGNEPQRSPRTSDGHPNPPYRCTTNQHQGRPQGLVRLFRESQRSLLGPFRISARLHTPSNGLDAIIPHFNGLLKEHPCPAHITPAPVHFAVQPERCNLVYS